MSKKKENDIKKEKPDKHDEKVAVDFGSLSFDEILQKMANAKTATISDWQNVPIIKGWERPRRRIIVHKRRNNYFTEIRRLRSQYEFVNNLDLIRFLAKNTNLVDGLSKAHSEILKYFKGANLKLELYESVEDGDVRLYIAINSDLPVTEFVALKVKLFRNWFNDFSKKYKRKIAIQ